MSGTIAVVVVSYERPRLLRECLASIGDCDQVVLADDGSLFDVKALAAEFDLPNLSFVFGEQRPAAERMVTPSCGRLLNRALRKVRTDYVVQALCDDDLLDPAFPRAAATALDAHPAWHLVAGKWGLFNDGETPDPAKLYTFNFPVPATAGNFVTRMTCMTDEDCWWSEESLVVHDGPMLWNFMARHGSVKNPKWLGRLDVLAGYRREHPKTISNNSLFGGQQYLPNTVEMFAPGAMESP